MDVVGATDGDAGPERPRRKFMPLRQVPVRAGYEGRRIIVVCLATIFLKFFKIYLLERETVGEGQREREGERETEDPNQALRC